MGDNNFTYPMDDGTINKSKEKSQRRIIVVVLTILIILQLGPIIFIYGYVYIFKDGKFPEPDYEVLQLRSYNATISTDHKNLTINTLFLSKISTTIKDLEIPNHANNSAIGEVYYEIYGSRIIPGENFLTIRLISSAADFSVGEYEIYYYWKNSRDSNRYQSSIFLHSELIEVESINP